MNTKEKILQVSEQIVLEKGLSELRLSDIAFSIGISQAAIYKHFQNKNDILSSLAWTWLEGILADIWRYKPQENDALSVIVHDWLWLLVSCKYDAYTNNPRLYELYSEFIVADFDLMSKHLEHISLTLSRVAELKKIADAQTLIFSVVSFENPNLRGIFDNRLKDNFESLWRVLEPGVSRLERKKVIDD